MNRRQATVALPLYRRQIIVCIGYTLSIKVVSSLVNSTLYKDLRKYLDRFYTYYMMSIEQFDYILAQIEHLIYKPNTNWQHSISAGEKLAICIRYLYLLSFKSIKHVHPPAPIFTYVERVLCRDGYV